MQDNPFKNVRIEFHILQSFPVTCLNRDDVGAPKTAIVGGVTRARVSSQAWKRPVRLAMRDFGVRLAIRTKNVAQLIENACVELGASAEEAVACGETLGQFLTKDTLHCTQHVHTTSPPAAHLHLPSSPIMMAIHLAPQCPFILDHRTHTCIVGPVALPSRRSTP